MLDIDIMEALTISIEEKIFKDWRHQGRTKPYLL